jgi:hypothetical protein
MYSAWVGLLVLLSFSGTVATTVPVQVRRTGASRSENATYRRAPIAFSRASVVEKAGSPTAHYWNRLCSSSQASNATSSLLAAGSQAIFNKDELYTSKLSLAASFASQLLHQAINITQGYAVTHVNSASLLMWPSDTINASQVMRNLLHSCLCPEVLAGVAAQSFRNCIAHSVLLVMAGEIADMVTPALLQAWLPSSHPQSPVSGPQVQEPLSGNGNSSSSPGLNTLRYLNQPDWLGRPKPPDFPQQRRPLLPLPPVTDVNIAWDLNVVAAAATALHVLTAVIIPRALTLLQELPYGITVQQRIQV